MIYTDILKRGKDAKPEKVGRVSCVDGTVTFDLPDGWKERFQSIEYKGKTYTPKDGDKFIKMLPQYLHGDYLWAARVVGKSTQKDVVKVTVVLKPAAA